MNTFRFTGVALTCHMHRKRLRCLIATGSLSSQCLHRSWYGLLAGLCLLPTCYLDIFGIHGEHLDNSRTQKGCCSCRAGSREFFHELMLLLQAWIGPPKWELLLSWLHLLICGITSWPSTGISSQVPLSSVSCCWKLFVTLISQLQRPVWKRAITCTGQDAATRSLHHIHVTIERCSPVEAITIYWKQFSWMFSMVF